MKKPIYFIFLLFLIWLLSAIGCPKFVSAKESDVTVATEHYKFNSSTLSDRVDEALLHGKNDYIGPIISLMEMYQKILEKY